MSCDVRPVSMDELNSMKEEWNSLTSNPFLSWEWITTWWHCFSEGKTPFVLKVLENASLIGIAPFFIQNREIQFCGASDLYPDYLDVISNDKNKNKVTQAVLQYLNQSDQWDQIHLDNLLEESSLLQGLHQFKSDWLHIKAESSVCPYVELGSTMDEYLARHFKKKKRYNLKRQVRVALEDNQIKLERIENKEDINTALDAFYDLHEKRARERKINSSITSKKVRQFIYQFTNQYWDSQNVQLAFLRKEGVAVSAAYALQNKEKIFFYQTGIDPQYDHLSIGTVLLTLLVGDACEKGKQEFDFLKGEEAYKNTWKTGRRTEYRVRLFRPDFTGRIQYFAVLAKKKIKSWLN